MKGLIYDIKRFTVHDGPGIRMTVFFKGCLLKCQWCHNPESQSVKITKTIKYNKLDGREFPIEVITGREVGTEEILEEALKEKIFFEESGGGVTLSGGEPLLQADFLRTVLITLRENGIHTAVDTCGYAQQKDVEKIAGLADLFLYDLKHIDNEKHIKYTSVSNKDILANLDYLISQNAVINLRIPVIPGFNESDKEMMEIADYLKPRKSGITRISLLPYHRIASHKYDHFGMVEKMKDTPEPDRTRMNEIQSIFSNQGYNVNVGA
jgi:pyruvate formate lyase activating enzyme